MDYPKLRNVEILPFSHNGNQHVLLRDPEQISEHGVIVPMDALFILQFFDGHHSMLDIRTEYARRFGTLLFEQELEKFVDLLNANLLLDNEFYHAQLRKVKQAYLQSSVRKARFAGQSYLAEPLPLKQQLDGFFAAMDGPGLPSLHQTQAAPRAILAPHIDIKAGGVCYSHGYKVLAESEPMDLYIILGTGHHPMSSLFSVTYKDFETPLGIARTDKAFVDSMIRECGEFLLDDETAHRIEHTIEFQVVFMQHVLGTNIKIVPILCSFDYLIFGPATENRMRYQFDGFIQGMKKLLRDFPGKIGFIASVDLAHVGRRYGDAFSPDIAFLGELRNYEEKLIDSIARVEAGEFLQLIRQVQNRYKVCGFPVIYSLLNILETGSGKLLNHSRTTVDNEGSMVTFASMSIY